MNRDEWYDIDAIPHNISVEMLWVMQYEEWPYYTVQHALAEGAL